MTTRTRFREYDLAVVDACDISRIVRVAVIHILCAARRGAQLVRHRRLEKEERHVDGLRLRCFPVAGVPACHCDFDWRNRLTADQRIEVQQPLLAEESDVQIDTIQRTERANRIRAVFEHTRRQDRVWRNKKLRQRTAGGHVIVQLFVVNAAWSKGFLSKMLCLFETWSKVVDRIHCARIVDVVT